MIKVFLVLLMTVVTFGASAQVRLGLGVGYASAKEGGGISLS